MRLGSRRVLVEADDPVTAVTCSGDLSAAGFRVVVCAGTGRCPLLEGQPCDLVDGADVVLHALRPGRRSARVRDGLARAAREVVVADGDVVARVFEAYGHRARGIRTRVRLRDGRTVTLRAIAPTDQRQLRVFDGGLSEESRRLRYLGFQPLLGEEEAAHLATVDFRRRFAFVASAGGRIVGDCRLIPALDGDAELGLVIADGYQGAGLGGRLLDLAVEVATARGFRRLVADVRYDNQRMARLLRGRGFDRVSWDLGIMRFARPLGMGRPPDRTQTPAGRSS